MWHWPFQYFGRTCLQGMWKWWCRAGSAAWRTKRRPPFSDQPAGRVPAGPTLRAATGETTGQYPRHKWGVERVMYTVDYVNGHRLIRMWSWSMSRSTFSEFKGTVSRDGFDFWWHVWLVLGQHRGRGHFFIFLSCSNEFTTQNLYFSRLMRVHICFIMLWIHPDPQHLSQPKIHPTFFIEYCR